MHIVALSMGGGKVDFLVVALCEWVLLLSSRPGGIWNQVLIYGTDWLYPENVGIV